MKGDGKMVQTKKGTPKQDDLELIIEVVKVVYKLVRRWL